MVFTHYVISSDVLQNVLPSMSGSGSGNATTASSSSASEGPSGNEEVERFCSNFCAPKRMELTRIRVIRHTPYRKKPSRSTDPKSVTPMQRVLEFPKEELTQSAGKLFCNACREELSLKLTPYCFE